METEWDKIRDIIAAVLKVDPREITKDSTLVRDLGADSLDLCMISAKIEEDFNVEIPINKANHVINAGEVLELLW